MEPLVFMNDIEILKNKGSKYLGLNFDNYVSLIQKIESSQLFLLSRFLGYQKYLPRENSIHTCPIESRRNCLVRCYVQD